MKSIYLLGAAACILAAPALAQTDQGAAQNPARDPARDPAETPAEPAPRVEDASGNAIIITAILYTVCHSLSIDDEECHSGIIHSLCRRGAESERTISDCLF